ncbi:MAG: DUF4253 domain-containing protein [Pirellulaceae bacterium]
MFSTEKVSGSRVLGEWETRLRVYPQTGQYPFLIGDAEQLEGLKESQGLDRRSVARVLSAAKGFDQERWIAIRRADAIDCGVSMHEVLGTWPSERGSCGEVSLHRDRLSGQVKDEVYLGMATIDEPWHLPAVLKFGGWNDCPNPEVHCAFHQQWFTEFGARIVGMSGDVVECVVQSPPRDRETAARVGMAAVLVLRPISSIGVVGRSVNLPPPCSMRYWFFWWD